MGPPQGTGWMASKTAGTTEPISVAGLRELETGENAADSASLGPQGDRAEELVMVTGTSARQGRLSQHTHT